LLFVTLGPLHVNSVFEEYLDSYLYWHVDNFLSYLDKLKNLLLMVANRRDCNWVFMISSSSEPEQMGRTIPSFRLALEMEKHDWKPFRNELDKSDRKQFDEMFDIPRLYTSACSYAVQPVRLCPILMSILHHFK